MGNSGLKATQNLNLKRSHGLEKTVKETTIPLNIFLPLHCFEDLWNSAPWFNLFETCGGVRKGTSCYVSNLGSLPKTKAPKGPHISLDWFSIIPSGSQQSPSGIMEPKKVGFLENSQIWISYRYWDSGRSENIESRITRGVHTLTFEQYLVEVAFAAVLI